MPIYEYECRGCGHRFEAIVRTSGPTPACPGCEGTDLERLLSMFAVETDGTRKSNFDTAKRQNDKKLRDKSIAEHEAAHHDHH
jgi:putative FmdB family regulatory protein